MEEGPSARARGSWPGCAAEEALCRGRGRGVESGGGAAPAEEEERGGGEPGRRGREAAAGRSGEPGGEEGVRVPLCGRGQMKNGSRVFSVKIAGLSIFLFFSSK